jgi:hypothetical protein
MRAHVCSSLNLDGVNDKSTHCQGRMITEVNITSWLALGLQGGVKEETAWSLKMWPKVCPETPAPTYQSALCNIPEERSYQNTNFFLLQ